MNLCSACSVGSLKVWPAHLTCSIKKSWIHILIRILNTDATGISSDYAIWSDVNPQFIFISCWTSLADMTSSMASPSKLRPEADENDTQFIILRQNDSSHTQWFKHCGFLNFCFFQSKHHLAKLSKNVSLQARQQSLWYVTMQSVHSEPEGGYLWNISK